jgi:riboflavin synthase
MFTGLVQSIATIDRVETQGPNKRLWIARPTEPLDGLSLGESLAVDGACLTVESLDGGGIGLFASAETLERTTVGRRRAGDRLNLERALAMGDRLGGHLVTGHVDGVGRFVGAKQRGEDFWCEFDAADPRWRPYLVEKGSIAVDGISLTVAAIDGDRFSVAVIPHTWKHTTLHARRPDDPVNLEFDLIGKYVLRWLEVREHGGEKPPGGVTLETLWKAGFV